jgi:hypothetical protein
LHSKPHHKVNECNRLWLFSPTTGISIQIDSTP